MTNEKSLNVLVLGFDLFPRCKNEEVDISITLESVAKKAFGGEILVPHKSSIGKVKVRSEEYIEFLIVEYIQPHEGLIVLNGMNPRFLAPGIPLRLADAIPAYRRAETLVRTCPHYTGKSCFSAELGPAAEKRQRRLESRGFTQFFYNDQDIVKAIYEQGLKRLEDRNP